MSKANCQTIIDIGYLDMSQNSFSMQKNRLNKASQIMHLIQKNNLDNRSLIRLLEIQRSYFKLYLQNIIKKREISLDNTLENLKESDKKCSILKLYKVSRKLKHIDFKKLVRMKVKNSVFFSRITNVYNTLRIRLKSSYFRLNEMFRKVKYSLYCFSNIIKPKSKNRSVILC